MCITTSHTVQESEYLNAFLSFIYSLSSPALFIRQDPIAPVPYISKQKRKKGQRDIPSPGKKRPLISNTIQYHKEIDKKKEVKKITNLHQRQDSPNKTQRKKMKYI